MKNVRILEVKASGDSLFLSFSDGVSGAFRFDDFFDFEGQLADLKDPGLFEKVKISEHGHFLFWSDLLDLDTDILYSIISKKPIVVDDKIVFDPNLGKKAWL